MHVKLAKHLINKMFYIQYLSGHFIFFLSFICYIMRKQKIKIQMLAAILGMVCFCCNYSKGQQVNNLFQPNDSLKTVQMHIHAMSNHGGHPKPASIQVHTARLAERNVNTIMWTEHSAVFKQAAVTRFTFINGVVDSVTHDILGVSGNSVYPVKYIADITGGSVNSSITDSSLTMQISSGILDTLPVSFTYTPYGRGGMLKGMRYLNRPLSSSPILSLQVLPHDLDQNGEAFISTELTYHYYNGKSLSQKLHYKFRTDVTSKTISIIDSFNVEIIVPVKVLEKSSLFLHLLDDAINLPDGADNTTISYKFGVKSKLGSSANVLFDNMVLHSEIPDAMHQYTSFQQHMNNYFQRYNVFAIQGCEYCC